MKRSAPSVCWPIPLIVLAAAAALAVIPAAKALHSLHDRYGAEQWWVDLKPWGDGRSSYLLCGLPYELPPEWGWGVENWDAQMGDYMEFDLAGDCFHSADTWLVWELQNECTDPSFGCWRRITWHGHGTWDELIRMNLYFNRDLYYTLGQGNPAWEDAFQTALSAHEWGHNLNLEDHLIQDMCWEPHLIMGYINQWQPPCLTGPTSAELNAVVANYGLLDLDFDGFSGAHEFHVGTDPADACPDNAYDPAWPPDFNNDRWVNILDVLMFAPYVGCSEGQGCYNNRFDLNANGTVNINDVLMLAGSVGMTCT